MTDKEWKELCEWIETIDCYKVVGFGFYDLGKYTIYKSGRISVNINKNRELELANKRTPAQIKAIIENLL